MDRRAAKISILEELAKDNWSESFISGILAKVSVSRRNEKISQIISDMLPEIAAEVCGVSLHKMADRTKKEEVILAIKLVSKELKDNFDWSYQAIADRFNRKNHTTIMSNIADLNNRLETGDPETVEKYELFKARVAATRKMLY